MKLAAQSFSSQIYEIYIYNKSYTNGIGTFMLGRGCHSLKVLQIDVRTKRVIGGDIFWSHGGNPLAEAVFLLRCFYTFLLFFFLIDEIH